MGLDEEDLRLCVGEILHGRPHKVLFSRQSPEKKYTALHVEIMVSDQADRDQLFVAFRQHPTVKFVL